jgi:hypothetical protein
VYQLVNFFVDLCLLRAAPQAMPASGVLLGLTLVLNVLVGVLILAGISVGPGAALGESLLEAGISLFALRLALLLRGHVARFRQTATALMGSNLLLGLAALPALDLGKDGDSELAVLGSLYLLLLMLWSMVVLGHILRHALELSLGEGVTLAALYTLISYAFLSTLFPLG